MRNPAAQGRPDSNHSEVVGWYEELYCSVVDTHELGGGMGDLLVGIAGVNDIVEVKTDGGQLLPSQVTFHRDWRGRKPIVIRTQADVINHVQQVRERVSRGKF
jgi:hypothetical protein